MMSDFGGLVPKFHIPHRRPLSICLHFFTKRRFHKYFLMKIISILTFLHLSFHLLAQTDSTKMVQPEAVGKVWQFNGNIQLNNNGISPVPAFSLGKPSLMSSLFVKKGGFTYSPEFNYGADGKPWVVNQWFRYQWTRGNFTYRTGLNFSLFFGREKVLKDNKIIEVVKLNQYTALEGGLVYKLSDKNSLSLTYWNSYGLDYGSVKSGHFLILSANFSHIPLSKSLFLQLRPNVFYLSNKVPFKGLFVSAITSIEHKKYPFSLFIQGVKPVWVAQETKSNWNYGLNYTF